jgi:hypothetical protein
LLLDVDALLTNPMGMAPMGGGASGEEAGSEEGSGGPRRASGSALEGAAEAIALLEAMQRGGSEDRRPGSTLGGGAEGEGELSAAAAAALGDSFGEADEADAAAAALRQEIEAQVKAEVDRKKRAQVRRFSQPLQ